jgi:hypothetical protein
VTGSVEAGALGSGVHRGHAEGGVAAESIHLEVVDWSTVPCGPHRLLESAHSWWWESACVS